MNIFKRIWNSITNSQDGEPERKEETKKTLEQLIWEMKSQRDEVGDEIIRKIVSAKKSRRKVREQKRVVDDWKDKAKQAVADGNDGLAKQYLEKQLEEEELLKTYDDAFGYRATILDKLRRTHHELNNKIESAEARRDLLIAKAQKIEAKRELNEIMQQYSTSDVSSQYKSMEKEIKNMEAEVDAEIEVQEHLSNNESDTDFEDFDRSETVNERLSELKKELED